MSYPLLNKIKTFLCIQYAKKCQPFNVASEIAGGSPLGGGRECAHLRGIKGWATFVAPEIPPEAGHAVGRPLHRPLPHAEGTGHGRGCSRTPASGRRFYLSGGTPGRGHPVRGGNCRADASVRRGSAPCRSMLPSRTYGLAPATRRRDGSPCVRIESAIALAPVFRPGRDRSPPRRVFALALRLPAEKWFAPARRSFGELAEAAEKAGTDLFVEKRLRRDPDHCSA